MAARYRSEYLAHTLQALAYLAMWLSLWHAAYAGMRPSAAVPDLAETLSYVVAVQFLHSLLGDDELLRTLYYRLRDGDVVVDLLRPVPLPLRLLAEGAGYRAFFVLCSSLPLYAAVIATLGLPVPRDPTVWAGCGLFALLAFATQRLFDLCLGLLAFWLMESRAPADILDFATMLVGGWPAPLWFYPGWLAAAAAYLPFRGAYALPAAVFVGRLAPPEWARAAAVQALWILALSAAALALWRAALRRVVVQGG